MGLRVNLRVTDILIPFGKIVFSYKSNKNKVAEYSREFSTIEKILDTFLSGGYCSTC